MAIPFPDLDPVALQLGPLAIRWYSLAYIAGVLGGWHLIKRELAVRPLAGLTPARMDDMVAWAIVGIILGGRIGYVAFYQPDYYLAHPLDALKIWTGGMAFHGGFLGFIVAFFLFCRRHGVPYLPLMDLMACVAPIGLGLGRLANFINGELWGRPSDQPWAMIFPHADALPRHPSQLYEAALEGGVLFLLLWVLLKTTRLRAQPGMLSGLFLVGYAMARLFCEQFREPDTQIGFLWHGLTMGQALTIPMLAVGSLLCFRARRT